MTTKAQTKEDVRKQNGLGKVYCFTCGKPIGLAGAGNISGCFCEKCKNQYTLDLREQDRTLKHSTYRLIMD